MKYFWILLNPLSITGANAAAPATLNGLVTLLPVHMRITIWGYQEENVLRESKIAQSVKKIILTQEKTNSSQIGTGEWRG